MTPSSSRSRATALPSSSWSFALLSSKCTPLTMIEPNPDIGPTETTGAAPVPPLSTPPQPAATSSAITGARSLRAHGLFCCEYISGLLSILFGPGQRCVVTVEAHAQALIGGTPCLAIGFDQGLDLGNERGQQDLPLRNDKLARSEERRVG